MAAMAPRSAPDAAEPLAAGRLRENERTVRGCRKILTSPRISRVVCATDAGREGELIFRYIYEAAQCGKPVSRLWISSLTPDAIRKGFQALRPASDYDPLADAARGRSRADWLVGMNLSRAYSLAYNEELSVGRVQTPTLAMLVERETAIRSFVPEDYLEVVATFRPGRAKRDLSGHLVPSAAGERGRQGIAAEAMRLPADGRKRTASSSGRARGEASIESIESADATDGPAAALRSYRTPAACQPPVRLQRAENARYRPGAL